jgi:hypothetical protein
METVRLHGIYKKLGRFLTGLHELYLVVSIETQTLLACENDAILERYNCSTSRFGNRHSGGLAQLARKYAREYNVILLKKLKLMQGI